MTSNKNPAVLEHGHASALRERHRRPKEWDMLAVFKHVITDFANYLTVSEDIEARTLLEKPCIRCDFRVDPDIGVAALQHSSVRVQLYIGIRMSSTLSNRYCEAYESNRRAGFQVTCSPCPLIGSAHRLECVVAGIVGKVPIAIIPWMLATNRQFGTSYGDATKH